MKYKLSFFFILILACIFVCLPSINAITLSGAKISPIIFVPGANISNHYTVSDYSGGVEISAGGELDKYISLTEMINNEFDLIIRFPEYIEPGTYQFGLTATEVAKGDAQGIKALTSVSKQFKIIVYSYDNYIDASLYAPSVNEGTPVDFQLQVASKCYKDINSIIGKITVFDPQNGSLATLTTEEKPLKSLATEILTASLQTANLPAAEYRAEATVFYDGEQKKSSTTFRIGNLNLVLKNYTKFLEQGYSGFAIDIFNNWGNPLRNVYAKVFIEDKEVLETPRTNLNPWGNGKLEGIIKVDLKPGIYDGHIQLFYEGESMEEKIKIRVIEKASAEELSAELKGSKKNIILLSAIIAVLIVTIIIVILKNRKNKK